MLALAVILILVGAVPCLIGVIFLYHELKRRRTAALIARAPTSPASAVAGMRPGQLVEVTGTLRCAKPIRSELARLPCAHYGAWVERTYQRNERDADDNVTTVERTEMLGAVARGTPFFVEDASGRVRVNPEGAGVDGRRVYDDFKEQPAQARMKLGGKTVELNYGLETRGYRMYEDILELDAPVYVLGVVTDDGSIGRPPKASSDADFIVSYRSEADVARAHQGDRLIFWCGVGALAGGGLLVLIGVAAGLIWAL